MKLFSVLATLGLLSGTTAFANFTVNEMQQMTTLSIEEFVRENPDHSAHLTGWKVWKSGTVVKVKIYADHGGMNMEFNYGCHKHGDGQLQCHVTE